MDAAFIVKFTPEENIDYLFDLICFTEREKFCVPVKAIGARGLLDMPDEISFPECPVRYNTCRTLLVRNIGERAAKFNIELPAPFVISPNSGFVLPGNTLQMDLQFRPKVFQINSANWNIFK